jgi:hypothetical protein
MHDPAAPDEAARGWSAAADWHHAAFTGLLLAAVTRAGTPAAAELVERIFSRQREARFLPGLEKLGLLGLPHAVAAAQYHYLSNDVGGVAVQFMPESDRKAWIRYVPPRWIWAGTALCGIPDALTVAMLRGWHACNGVSLGNPRLGFVCTKTTTRGDAALEGYYLEHDRPLAPDERLRFACDEDGPEFDPTRAPRLPAATWPPGRLAKARRNYATEYVRSALPVAFELLGERAANDLVRVAFRQVGMQHRHLALEKLGLPADEGGAAAFARFLAAMLRGQGDEACVVGGDADAATVEQRGIRPLEGTGLSPVVLLPAWSGTWEGALAAHDARLGLAYRYDEAAGTVTWTVARRGPRRAA